MKRWLQTALAVTLAGSISSVSALDRDSPPYQPGQSVSGIVRVWESEQMQSVTRRWQEGFHRYHPNARVVVNRQGSDTAVAGLYTGSADVALLGRDPTASELQAFEWIFRYKPTQLEVMTGSLDAPGKSPALVAFVHKDNPLSKLTLAQLDAIFGHDLRRGEQGIRTWGQLGLRGKWANRPIHLYGFDAYSGSGRFFRHLVLLDSRNMNWDRVREIADRNSDGPEMGAGRRILYSLSKDRLGIAVSNLPLGKLQVKPLALAVDVTGPFVAATKENLVSRNYPLVRAGIALINRASGQAVDPTVKEFLRYILSREGQDDIVKEGNFLPLNPGNIEVQLHQLD